MHQLEQLSVTDCASSPPVFHREGFRDDARARLQIEQRRTQLHVEARSRNIVITCLAETALKRSPCTNVALAATPPSARYV